MTPALTAALGEHYHKAVIAADQPTAVAALVETLRGNADLIAEATAYHASLAAFAKAVGGIDRMRQRDFGGATHLQGLTEALAQL